MKHEPPDPETEAYDHFDLKSQAAFLDQVLVDAGVDIEIVEIPVAEKVRPQPAASGSVTAFLRRPTG